MRIQERNCRLDYPNMLRAKTILINGADIGDIVEVDSLGDGHRVVLAHGMRPYSNAHFATHEGALNYMKLVAGAVRAAA